MALTTARLYANVVLSGGMTIFNDEGIDSVGSTQIGLDHVADLQSTAEFDEEKTFKLTDANNTTVGAERFRCAEVTLTFARSCTPYRAVRWHGQVPRSF